MPQFNGQYSCPAFEDLGLCKPMAVVGFAVMASQSRKYHPVARCSEYMNAREQASCEDNITDFVDFIRSLGFE